MLFNSSLFVLFAAVVFPAAWLLRGRARKLLLLVASYAFYGAWDWRFLGLLAGSTVVDYLVAEGLRKSDDVRRRRLLLLVSCVANLGALGFFKYADFFVASADALLQSLGLGALTGRLGVVLPVGISFYTFQTMSYTIDVYRRRLEPCRDVVDFALYVSFFPQLVAGPIERATHLLPQIERPRGVTRDDLAIGAWLITLGYFKKCVVADNLAVLVDQAFNAESTPSGLVCLLALYGFAFQIYCDFGGYSDIARGLARLLGFDLSVNFRFPYVATNPQEFWHRWHVSLSTWLRDYLYIPLGGSRGGTLATYRNLLLTMVLGGLWHGASWLFVLWGLYHGLLLCAHRAVVGRVAGRTHGSVLPLGVRWFGMFHLTCLGWLLFRARSVGQVGSFLGHIATFAPGEGNAAALVAQLLLFVGMLTAVELWARNRDDVREAPLWRWGVGPAVVVALWTAFLLLRSTESAQFIYFQF